MKSKLWRLSRPDSKYLARVLFVILVCLSAVPVVHAGIVSSSGVTVLGSPPPPGVHPGDQPQPTLIVFPEVFGKVVGGGGLPVDHKVTGDMVASPVLTAEVVNPNLVSGSLPAGTLFDSYFFHFDPKDDNSSPFYDSTILFSTKILGVQLFSNGDAALQKPATVPYVGTLEAGDSAIASSGGPPLSYYPGGLATRGVESGDALAITDGGFGIELAGQAFNVEIDQVRILVSVPEPATLTMAFAGILGIMVLGRTRSRAVCS